ncbi:MAG: protein kinase [Myxococcales bacterium]|nr:protein kinase [Myxococcales bacterium]
MEQSDDTRRSFDPLIGLSLGDFRLEERIGTGGMGVVYRAVQPLISKTAAIKVIRQELAGNQDQVERLLAEARAVNTIRHRNIVDVYGFGTVPDGRCYIVMEFLEGQPLDELISKRAPLAANEVIPYLDEVCSALAAAHARGFIHRDLKPSNVFLVRQPDGSRFVKLLDFGLAKQAPAPGGIVRQTSELKVCGTPEYMAPEQARGGSVGPPTDLYSLGVMTFEMLTGRLPFSAPSPIEMMMRQCDTPPPAPSSVDASVPAAMDELVLSLLAKEGASRPQSAELVRASLKRIARQLQESATRIASAGAPPPTREPAHVTTLREETVGRPRSRQLALGAIAAVAFATLGGLVAWLWPGRESAPSAVPELPPIPEALVPPLPISEPRLVEPSPAEPRPIEPPPAIPRGSPAAPKERPPPRKAMPVKLKPEPKRAPQLSAQSLLERIELLSWRLKAAAPPGEEADKSALALLDRQKKNIAAARGEKELKTVSSYLDAWEKAQLGRAGSAAP